MGLLRLLLAISVFLLHVGVGEFGFLRILDGRAAVSCFFVISGFYMEMVCAEKYTVERLGSSLVRKFYLARFWRLYPTYLLIVVFTLLLSALGKGVEIPVALSTSATTDVTKLVRCVLTWIPNIFMIGANLPSTSDLLIAPSWSLGVELSFYLLAPYILRASAPWLIGCSALGLALQFLPFGQHSPFLFGIQFFILGAISRRYSQKWIDIVSSIALPRAWWVYSCVLILIFLAIPHELYVGGKMSHGHNTIDELTYPILVGALAPLLHALTSRDKVDYWVGQLSFPFYLVHVPVIALFGAQSFSGKVFVMLAICLIASAIITMAEVRFVEPWRSHFARSTN